MRLSVRLKGSCTRTGAWACKQADHAAASRLLTCMEHHALVQSAVLLSLCTLNPCLRKEAYPEVLVGWARTIPLLHVEGIDINASLSPCVPAGMLRV